MQCDVFGRRGDFITSPEISQVFGEVGYIASLVSELHVMHDIHSCLQYGCWPTGVTMGISNPYSWWN